MNDHPISSEMHRLLAAAGWDAGSLRHKQLEDALDGAKLRIVAVSRPDDGDGVHLWHCNQGHYLNVCKYGDDDCPALTAPPAAAESNASVEARLREAVNDMLGAFAEGVCWSPEQRAAYEKAAKLVSPAGGDGAKKSEGIHKPSPAFEAAYSAFVENVTGRKKPSDPTAERREIVARALMEKWPGDYAWGDETREPNELAFETADAILAALDGGAGA